jgi:hypothetical protein
MKKLIFILILGMPGIVLGMKTHSMDNNSAWDVKSSHEQVVNAANITRLESPNRVLLKPVQIHNEVPSLSLTKSPYSSPKHVSQQSSPSVSPLSLSLNCSPEKAEQYSKELTAFRERMLNNKQKRMQEGSLIPAQSSPDRLHGGSPEKHMLSQSHNNRKRSLFSSAKLFTDKLVIAPNIAESLFQGAALPTGEALQKAIQSDRNIAVAASSSALNK